MDDPLAEPVLTYAFSYVPDEKYATRVWTEMFFISLGLLFSPTFLSRGLSFLVCSNGISSLCSLTEWSSFHTEFPIGRLPAFARSAFENPVSPRVGIGDAPNRRNSIPQNESRAWGQISI